MLEMNDIKKGKMVVLDGQPYVVVSADFLKKQQRRPVVRSVLKNLSTGQTKEHTFMQSDKVEEAEIEREKYQFLYEQSDDWQFMNPDTYEQITLSEGEVGEATRFLIEGQEVELMMFDGHAVMVELPIKIKRRVVVAPPGVKGDTSTNVMKEVQIEGGAKIKAPLFIKDGDKIVIDTRTGEYVERA
jgi:elongation factor P